MARLSPKARLAFAIQRAEDTGACKCQRVSMEIGRSGVAKYVVSRTRTVKARCKHWFVVDEWSGTLTDMPATPRIGGQRRLGTARADHKAMLSPWNKQGPSIGQMR